MKMFHEKKNHQYLDYSEQIVLKSYKKITTYICILLVGTSNAITIENFGGHRGILKYFDHFSPVLP